MIEQYKVLTEVNIKKDLFSDEFVIAHIIDNEKIGEAAWSSKNIVDKLCPSFEESGSMITCEPLEDYPLEVVSTINEKEDGSAWNSITLKLNSKNLFDVSEILTWTGYRTYNVSLPAGTYIVTYSDCSHEGADVPYLRFRDNSKGVYFNNKTTKITLTKPETVIYIYTNGYSNPNSQGVTATVNQLMISVSGGSYEPYKLQTFTIDLSEYAISAGSYNWTTGVLYSDEGSWDQLTPIAITALDGTNVLYSDCGNTEVKGKADPVKIIEKLTNAILALGGNI